MYLSEDYTYISDNDRKLVEKGYGQLSVHSIHFDRYYSEEEKQENRKAGEKMTSDEWSARCNKVSETLSKFLTEIAETFAKKYDLHQYSEENNTLEHYKSDWDLFFYSNRGWNGKDYMDYFSLTFNKQRTAEQNMKLLKEIIPFVGAMEYKNIGCRIQYDVVIDTKKVAMEAERIFDNLSGKSVLYHGLTGKIKVVGEENGFKEYGFFKKGARKTYYALPPASLIAMEA